MNFDSRKVSKQSEQNKLCEGFDVKREKVFLSTLKHSAA